MKKIHLIYAACLLVGMGACAASVQKQVKDNSDVWKEYNTGAVLFEDKAPETLGSDIYHRIIPDADTQYTFRCQCPTSGSYRQHIPSTLGNRTALQTNQTELPPTIFLWREQECHQNPDLGNAYRKPSSDGYTKSAE